MTLRNAYIRLSLNSWHIRLKNLLPLVEACPEAVLKQTDIRIVVPNPIDPIPEPVDQKMWDAHTLCDLSARFGIEITDPRLLELDKEFLRRRDVNDAAGKKSGAWEVAEQQRLQNLLDSCVKLDPEEP